MDVTELLAVKAAPQAVFDALPTRRARVRFMVPRSGGGHDPVTLGAFAEAIRGVALWLEDGPLRPGERAAFFGRGDNDRYVNIDFAYLAISSWRQGRWHELMVFGPRGTRAFCDAILKSAFAPDIRWRKTIWKKGVSDDVLVRVQEIEEGEAAKRARLRVGEGIKREAGEGEVEEKGEWGGGKR